MTQQPVEGIFDKLTEWEKQASRLSPVVLYKEFRTAQATLLDYADRLEKLQRMLITAILIIRTVSRYALPVLKFVLARYGITIPDELLALITAKDPPTVGMLPPIPPIKALPAPVVGQVPITSENLYPSHPLAEPLGGHHMAGEHLQG